MGEGSGIAVSCGVGRRRGLDLVLLWLWCRPVATVLIGPLAWEPPHAAGVALKKEKKKVSWEKCLAEIRSFDGQNTHVPEATAAETRLFPESSSA